MKKILKKTLVFILIFWQLFYCPAVYAQEVTLDPSPSPIATSDPTPDPSSSPSPTDQAIIQTGDATSSADTTNVVNASTVNSNIVTDIQTVDATQSGDINLQSPVDYATPVATDLPEGTISATQDATVSSTTQSTSDTGTNVASVSGTTDMTTGDATALANSINAVNLNLVNSTVVSAIINITGDLEGDIILPNPELLIKPITLNSINLVSSQTATVDASTATQADTGQNTQQAETSTVSTGDATSLSTNTNVTNSSTIGVSQSILTINNLGNWNGNLINWDTPGSSVTLLNGTYDLTSTILSSVQPCNNACSTTIISDQKASVQTTTSAVSNTGQNSQVGQTANLVTGNATSLANNITLTNITGVGSNLFVGIINILGTWNGNLIVAYPRLKVSVTDNKDTITSGSNDTYFITVTNEGKAKATGVTSTFTIPSGFTTNNQLVYSWDSVNPGETKSYQVEGNITGQVGVTLQSLVNVTTTNTQDSTGDNTGSDTTQIIDNVSQPPKTPDLGITISTNVNDYIYAGDTVRVYVNISNNSPFDAQGVTLQGQLTGGKDLPAIPFATNIGTIPANGKIKMEFNIELLSFLPEGTYTINVSSANASANTTFLLKALSTLTTTITPPVLAQTNPLVKGSVLGASTVNNYQVKNNPNILVIVFGLAVTYLLTHYLKHKFHLN